MKCFNEVKYIQKGLQHLLTVLGYCMCGFHQNQVVRKEARAGNRRLYGFRMSGFPQVAPGKFSDWSRATSPPAHDRIHFYSIFDWNLSERLRASQVQQLQRAGFPQRQPISNFASKSLFVAIRVLAPQKGYKFHVYQKCARTSLGSHQNWFPIFGYINRNTL